MKLTFNQRQGLNDFYWQHPLPNGFTLLVGDVFQDDVTNTSDGWFVIIDNVGCDVVNCASRFTDLIGFEIKIYPNPASDFLTIDLDKAVGELKLKLINLSGQEVEAYQ